MDSDIHRVSKVKVIKIEKLSDLFHITLIFAIWEKFYEYQMDSDIHRVSNVKVVKFSDNFQMTQISAIYEKFYEYQVDSHVHSVKSTGKIFRSFSYNSNFCHT